MGHFWYDVTIPSRVLLLDLMVHHELTEALSPELRLYSQNPYRVAAGASQHELIIEEPLIDLGSKTPLGTSLVDRSDEMIVAVLDRGGWQRSDFHCLRLVYEYPPTPSTIELRYPLPELPDTK